MTTEQPAYLNEDGVARLARLVDYFESSESASSTSRKLSERDRDYYDNFDDSQWTEAEKAALKKRKQPVTTSNRMKVKVNYLLGIESQKRSLPKAFHRNPQDEEGANAATDALRFVIEDNRYAKVRSASFKSMTIEGACGADVSVEFVGKDVKIRINEIEWDRMFWDAHSRKPNFSDAKYLGQVIWKDVEDAIAEFPGSKEVIERTFTAEASMSTTYEDAPRIVWADSKRKRIRIVGVWHLEGGTWYHCIYTKGGIISEEESPYVNEEGKSVPSFIYGSCYVDRDGNRYGAVRDWVSIQDEINKRRSKALHLLSVRQTKGDKGAVEDVNKVRSELARPDGHIEVTPGMLFDVLPTGDMAQAQFELLAEAKSEIDSIGVNAAMAGSETRVMSGRALMKREESGLAEMGPLFDALNQYDLDIYRAVWMRIKQFWTAEKWVRVTDDERNVRFVGLNVPLTLSEQMLEQAQQQGIEITDDMRAQAKNDPELQQVVGTKNNVAELDVDITIDQAPASASLQGEQFEILAELAKVRPDIPTSALIETSSLRNKDKLLKQMGADGPAPEMLQVQEQMKQMAQQLEQVTQALEQEKASKAIEAEKVQIDRMNAETARMKAEGELQLKAEALNKPEPAQLEPVAQEQGVPEIDKMHFEARLKIHLRQMELANQERLKRMELGKSDESTPQTQAADAAFLMSDQPEASDGMDTQVVLDAIGALAQQVQQLGVIMTAPKELIRDPQTGRAIGSRIVLDNQMEPQ